MAGLSVNILETILKRSSELSMQLLPDNNSWLQYKYEYNKFKHWCEEPTPHMNQVSD